MKVQAIPNFPKSLESLTTSPATSSSSPSVSSDSKAIFSKVQVISKINDSRFPVFLVNSGVHNKKCALKLFPYKDERINQAYLNEARFAGLKHPNVVNILACIDKQKSSSGNKRFTASCTLMELAPHGDFADFLLNKRFYRDEKLARTYFHQLIEGIEYLHSKGVAHMDLKLENLLLGADHNLKIADFDLAWVEGDRNIRGKGTCNYRSPELMERNCENPKAADLYSAGVILFTFKTGGFPCLEDTLVENEDLYGLMFDEEARFWEVHNNIHKRKIQFEDDFKELFMSLVRANPNERATISDIKKSKWYQGPVYTPEELAKKLREFGIYGSEEVPKRI